MAAEAGGDIRAGIGTRLRAAREKKSLTILQAAEKMHVDARILESLEAEDFAALGAPGVRTRTPAALRGVGWRVTDGAAADLCRLDARRRPRNLT